jgi:putative transposase
MEGPIPWRHTPPMDQRTQFSAEYLRESVSITERCRVSRKTGYTWIERYLQCGPAGLEAHS